MEKLELTFFLIIYTPLLDGAMGLGENDEVAVTSIFWIV